MEINWTWGQAWQITYMSFGLVLAILIMLAVVTWLIGFIGGRKVRSANETVPEHERTSPEQ